MSLNISLETLMSSTHSFKIEYGICLRKLLSFQGCFPINYRHWKWATPDQGLGFNLKDNLQAFFSTFSSPWFFLSHSLLTRSLFVRENVGSKVLQVK